ncbi:MAG: S9 family peptidase [Acidobacteriota bacterium]
MRWFSLLPLPTSHLAARFLAAELLTTLLLGILLPSPAARADGLRPMVPEDYFRFTFLSSPQISPDSTEVVYVAAKVSEDRRSRESSLWLVSTAGGDGPLQLTVGDTDAAPKWSPDGRWIAFLRTVETPASQDSKPKRETQVFRIRRNGGEAQPLTSVEGGVTSFLWSPDGRHLLLTRRTEEDGEMAAAEAPDGENLKEASEDSDEPQPDIKVVRSALYKRNGTGYLDDKQAHFWWFDIETRTTRRLTAGAGWNDENPSISPDGSHLVFDADRSGEEYDGGPNDDLWIVPITDDGGPLPKARQLTDHPHSDTAPSWSPNGDSIAYLHTDGPYEQTEILLRDAAGSAPPRRLTDGFDRHPSNLRWAADGQGLFFLADDRGARRLFHLDLPGGRIRQLLSEQASVADLEVAPRGDLLTFTLHDETRLAEVWVCRPDGSEARALTRANAELLAELERGALETLDLSQATGSFQGFVLKPVGWRAGASFPLVLQIKGGPGGMWGHRWMHEFQMLAGKGWGVAFVNYRGSTGYGEAHQNAVRQDYGGVDAQDNLDFLEQLLERNPWIDRERLFLTGGSHGGFLTNWILTRTDRFRAAVTQRSVSNWVSEAGTQQYTPRQMNVEFGGSLWENYDLYWDRSPIKHADRISTPTLILHGDQDHICPIGQAQELFYALKANGVETELVIFEGENHSLSRTGTPINLVERLRRIIEWFERHS